MKEPTLHDVFAAVGRVQNTLHDHSQSLDRIERQQRAETKSLDDHEVRIKKLERRRKSGRAPES